MSKMFPENLRIDVKQRDIDDGKCLLPNKCMIKLAVKRAIGGHGYVAVDSTGISITRRSDYREKAFLPRAALAAMVQFDKDKTKVKPFSFVAKFFKTTKIGKTLRGDHAKRLKRQAETRKKTGAGKLYAARRRVIGLATAA